MKILIIGAGIIGLTTAYSLVQRGHHVLVVERESGPGRVSSYMNGGQFSYSYAEPLASPSLPRQLPAMLFGRHAALKFKIAAFPPAFTWGRKFLLNCTPDKFTENTKSVLRLAQLSRKEMELYLSRNNADFDFRETGKLHLYQDLLQLQNIASLVGLKNSLGFQQEIWDTDQCLEREPALKQYQGQLAGAVFSPLDQSGDTYKLVQSLMANCEHSGRFELHTGIEVTGIEARNDMVSCIKTTTEILSADAYILCAGADSPSLFRTLGNKLPIIPVKGYSITVPALAQAPQINLTDTQHKIVFTKLGKNLRIAGMMEFSGQDLRIDKHRIDHLLQLADSSLPKAGNYTKLLSSWTGLRPMTPDNVPLIGSTRWQNLWLNTGHGMLGSTLAFGSARLVTDLLDKRDCLIARAHFHPGRFDQL